MHACRFILEESFPAGRLLHTYFLLLRIIKIFVFFVMSSFTHSHEHWIRTLYIPSGLLLFHSSRPGVLASQMPPSFRLLSSDRRFLFRMLPVSPFYRICVSEFLVVAHV